MISGLSGGETNDGRAIFLVTVGIVGSTLLAPLIGTEKGKKRIGKKGWKESLVKSQDSWTTQAGKTANTAKQTKQLSVPCCQTVFPAAG